MNTKTDIAILELIKALTGVGDYAVFNACENGIKALKSDAELRRKRLKEYEDLEEQGLLVKLPCRVGDTVHTIINGAIVSDVVDRIEINESCQKVSTKKHSWLCNLSKIYPTAEDAEKAKKEMIERENSKADKG